MEAKYLAETNSGVLVRLIERLCKCGHTEHFWGQGTRRGCRLPECECKKFDRLIHFSERKQTLFCLACARKVWDVIPEGVCRDAIETAELFIEGLVTIEDMEHASKQVDYFRSQMPYRGKPGSIDPEWAATSLAAFLAQQDEELVTSLTSGALGRRLDLAPEWMAQTLRGIIGNPFQPIPADLFREECQKCHGSGREQGPWLHRHLCPACDGRGWNPTRLLTPTVLELAEMAYREKDWPALPIIADELEANGLTGPVCKMCEGKGVKVVPVYTPPRSGKCPHCGGRLIERENLRSDRERWCQRCWAVVFGSHEYQDNSCPDCKEGRQPSPILAHLRKPCPYCLDAAFDFGDAGTRTDQSDKQRIYWNRKCVCKGTRLAEHWRGDWALDAILGKE